MALVKVAIVLSGEGHYGVGSRRGYREYAETIEGLLFRYNEDGKQIFDVQIEEAAEAALAWLGERGRGQYVLAFVSNQDLDEASRIARERSDIRVVVFTSRPPRGTPIILDKAALNYDYLAKIMRPE